MKVLKVYSKETFVEIELSMINVKHILDFLDKSRVDFNSREEPEMVEATNYVKNGFFKTLSSIHDEFEKGVI